MKYFLLPFFTFFIILQNLAQIENTKPMTEWQYPYEVQKTIVSDSIELAYIDEGQSDITLLFVHGLGSNLKAWNKNINLLKNDYRCIALDLPGYGKSSKSNYPFDISFFAETVLAFINKLELENVVLIGHSMGGQISMNLVLKNPNSIDKLILIAPAGFEIFSDQEKKWFQTFYTPAVVKATSEENIVKNFKLNFYDMPEDANFMIEDRFSLLNSAEYDYYCDMVPKCVLGMLDEPVYNQLDKISMSTLVIFGEEDMLIPNRILHPNQNLIDIGNNGQNRISSSKIEFIPNAGHFVQWEKSDKVNEVIHEFLK